LRSSGLFYTVSGQILAHCGDEWFRVGHHPIVAPVQEPSLKQSECLTIGEFWLEETAS
jgi:hypothetical protein